MEPTPSSLWRPEAIGHEAARQAGAFRGAVRNIAQDASHLLCELRRGEEPMSDRVRERLHLAHYYMDRLMRLCDGGL